MPRFKWEMSVFVCQLQQRVRIAVGIFCSSWHMGHPPKAMKYITCGVMPFRPWHAFCGPLVKLSCHHSGISLLPSIPSTSPSLLLICSTRLSQPHSFGFGLHCPLFSSLPSLSCVAVCTPLLRFPLARSSSATGVPGSATAHCGAMIQKPHINTGILPRDYLSVACLPGRVLLCNLYSPVNRVGLGERGFVGV